MGSENLEAADAAALRVLRRQGRRFQRASANLERIVADRDEAIVAAAQAGAPRQAIADAAGVSIQRVKQVISEHGAARPYRRGRE